MVSVQPMILVCKQSWDTEKSENDLYLLVLTETVLVDHSIQCFSSFQIQGEKVTTYISDNISSRSKHLGKPEST